MKKITTSILFAAFALTNLVSHAQIKTPQPSPIQTIKQEVGLAEVEINYSRPSVKGRKIFGDVVPFGETWRTGANASSKIKFNDAITFGGVKVEKGEYALYTVPGQTEWAVILYKDLTCWGVCDEYKKENEVARVLVKPTVLTSAVETFTISLENIVLNGATLRLSWEKTAVDVKLENDVDSKVMASIDGFMNPKADYRPYYNAATYYYDSNKDLKKALEWATKAYEINPGFWVSHLKAKIQVALKDYAGAIQTAEISKKAALEAKNNDYAVMNDKLIAKVKATK